MYNKLEDMDVRVNSFGESVKKIIKQKKSDKDEIKTEVMLEVKKDLSTENKQGVIEVVKKEIASELTN